VTIKAIETRYAGCRFRSRLEARWAVFFDHLHIAWKYEPEGFVCGPVRYLPDFTLPGHIISPYASECVTEVKAVLDETSANKMMQFVKHANKSLLVLSDIPDHMMLGPHFHWLRPHKPIDGWVELDQISLFYIEGELQATPFGRAWIMDANDTPALLQCWQPPIKAVCDQQELVNGYTAARAARFEHGESGAPAAKPPVKVTHTTKTDQPVDQPNTNQNFMSIISDLFGAFSGHRNVEWCGQCNGPRERQRVREDGRLIRCPDCHPLVPEGSAG
jgi:hypothetical protein